MKWTIDDGYGAFFQFITAGVGAVVGAAALYKKDKALIGLLAGGVIGFVAPVLPRNIRQILNPAPPPVELTEEQRQEILTARRAAMRDTPQVPGSSTVHPMPRQPAKSRTG